MSAAEYVPERPTLPRLRAAMEACRGCDLYGPATQAVPGEGPAGAKHMLVGEAPGDVEDKTGHPFAGPAGRELDKALEAVGLARDEVYVTNAVKHFKFEERGKRRIHQKPSRAEVKACWPWLDTELDIVHPHGILALGATAATALLGSKVRVMRDRGIPLESDLAEVVMVTIHPSAILRGGDEERREIRRGFTADVEAFVAAVAG